MAEERDWWWTRVEAMVERIARLEIGKASHDDIRDLEGRLDRRMDRQDQSITDLRKQVHMVGRDLGTLRSDINAHTEAVRGEIRALEARQAEARQRTARWAIGLGGAGVAIAAGAPEVIPVALKLMFGLGG